MKTLSSWLLGGALAASLTWNWTLIREPSATASGSTPRSCSLGATDPELAPDARRRLAELCATSCREADRLEQRADELQAELLAGLTAPEVDEKATAALVEEVSELRHRSLASCVRGVLGVREVLSGEEVRALLESCENGPADCHE